MKRTESYLVIITCCVLLFSNQLQAQFITTTEKIYWEKQPSIEPVNYSDSPDIIIDTNKIQQTIEGFGSCFNELGWESLSLLSAKDREGIMKELFSPEIGANFVLCRMPIGANDFALDWYSYNETENDFEMKNFSIKNDKKTLIPFIKNAQKYYPDLRIWASPWCPPSWMKYNKHYASSSADNNGLPEDRQGFEGTDMFIQEDSYLKAYALYFSKFIDAYKTEGINIFAVMPQNEFNSAQIFPSCCWTAKGLANFIGEYLGPAMDEKGVEVMFGTMERPNELLVDTIMTNSASKDFITGIGFQWAGKDALPKLYKKYSGIKLYQTEQECGDGKNNWEGAMYSWDLMKHYLNHGITGYMYWNTSLMQGGISRWGWAQNSLVVVNEDGSFVYTPEYYVMKHASHFVMPGAKKIELEGLYNDALAFVNPDKSIAVIICNKSENAKLLTIKVNNQVYTPSLKANSLSTLLVK